jgi:hypothetical protein
MLELIYFLGIIFAFLIAYGIGAKYTFDFNIFIF